MSDDSQSVTRTVPVPAARLFAVLVDPGMHAEIDGSGMVQGAATHEPITGTGDVFRIDMRHPAFGDYQMDNHVREYVEGERIAWAPARADAQPVGHVWIWELQSEGDGTVVVHTYDWSGVPEELRAQIPFPVVTEEQMGESIDKLAAAVD
jgi:uncharacterized protein YndB with AHSA1/START domain